MTAAPEFQDAFREQLRALFTWRRDVRHFKCDALAPNTLERLIALAALSPSVGFSQPWRFVSVEAADKRAAIITSFERANAQALTSYDDHHAAQYARLKLAGLREAPAHLAVFCDDETVTGKGLGRATMPETLAYSCAMAIYTLWLAARSEEIGVGWVSILEPSVVTAVLEVPPSWRLIGYLCLGFPSSESETPELERVGWETRDDRATLLYRR